MVFIIIANLLNTTVDYLLTGEEKEKTSPSLTEDEQELLSVYKNLGRRVKTKTLATAYDELDLLKSNK